MGGFELSWGGIRFLGKDSGFRGALGFRGDLRFRGGGSSFRGEGFRTFESVLRI